MSVQLALLIIDDEPQLPLALADHDPDSPGAGQLGI